MLNQIDLGVIEGFYGHPWSWQARFDYAEFMAENQLSFYIYAPKSDSRLRSCWQQDWSDDDFNQLQNLSRHYQQNGIDFGMALSPFELYKNWDHTAQTQLAKKIKRINQINPSILCILFDDMRGDFFDAAQRQIEIIHFAKQVSSAQKIIMCPTYYSYEPILETLFGKRPSDYWQELGAGLDNDIEIFWTGEKVCSTTYSLDHISEINDELKRHVSLWDNYPVNDGKNTSPYLHLKGFENRPSSLARQITRHAINPMNAAHLSKIAILTLIDSYQLGEKYDAQISQQEAIEALCEPQLAQQIIKDTPIFQQIGLHQLSPEKRQMLLTKYQSFNGHYANEICAWLEGYYEFDPACLTG